MRDKRRILDCIKYGIIDTLITMAIITVLFELIARPLSMLFALTGGASAALVDICAMATRAASLGFIFMGFSVAIQGVLQALGYASKPLILSFMRLVIFVFPIAFAFTRCENVTSIIWWTFPIAEVLTAIFAYIFLKRAKRAKVDNISE